MFSRARLSASGIFAAAIVGAIFPITTEGASARFFYSPTVNGESIAFIHGSEIWVVGTDGGNAWRLTADGLPKRNLEFSRDGKLLAYSAVADRDLDIYTIELNSADPKPVRRTWHPADDEVRGWNANGEIVFTSDRHHWSYADLYTLALDEGLPTRLPIGKAAAADFSPDGDHVVFAPIEDASDTWKRYRGGMTSPLWIVDMSEYSHVEIPHEKATDTEPVWIDDTIYFRSDRTGVRAIHVYDESSGRVSKLETGVDAPIDGLDANGRMLVFSSEGYLYRIDRDGGEAQRLDINIEDAENPDTLPIEKDVSTEINNASLSPDGRSVVFEAHGDIFLLRPGQSVAINLTDSPGAGDRGPVWGPDGRRIVFLSDQSGEYAYHVLNTSDTEKASRQIDLGNKGFGFGVVFSPNGRRLAYIDHTGKPWWCDIEKGVFRPIDVQSDLFPTPVWSADGETIYLPRFESRTGYAHIVAVDIGSGEIRQLSEGLANVASLSLSADGSRFFFLASDKAGPTATRYDFSQVLYQDLADWAVYSLAVEEPPQGRPRIVRHQAKPRRYSALYTLSDGRILLEEDPPREIWNYFDEADRATRRLYVFDPDTSSEFEIEEDIQNYDVAKGDTSLLAFQEDELRLIDLTGKAETNATVIPVEQALVRNDPAAEYIQMFEETWRSARDFFYDPDLHGVDWKAMRARYRTWVQDVRHRDDFDFALKNLLSELVNSHISVVLPRAREDNGGEKSGMLGADFVLDDEGYRVEKVLRVPFWSEVRSPLPDVVEGQYLTAINDVETSRSFPLYEMLTLAGGDKVQLTFASAATDVASLDLEVDSLTAREDKALRYREWVERKRDYVGRASDGQIAYLHQPDTSGGGLREFIRYFFPQTDKAAIIIDERFNNGGADPDYQLDVLGRTAFQLYAPRDLSFFPSPNSVIDGPKVMLVNAEAGSGGDLYPYQFKQRNLGTVIGTRTWGGVQGGFRGAWPEELIDGGRVSISDLGTYSVDGDYILENSGLTPDLEVEIYPNDYAAGRDPQLQRAVSFLLDQIEHGRTGTTFPARVERVDRSLEKP